MIFCICLLWPDLSRGFPLNNWTQSYTVFSVNVDPDYLDIDVRKLIMHPGDDKHMFNVYSRFKMDLLRTLARRSESGKSEALKVLITFVIKSSTILISSDKQRCMITQRRRNQHFMTMPSLVTSRLVLV